jgi:MoaA/NifB/PqqE/SkfB family radical SAM enzyme
MTTYSRIRQEEQQIGRQEGILQNQVKIILNCHENKIPVPLIANITQLNENEVISILKDNGRISK